jgi:TPP-dependent pyruvate/acetoin dehydrogenase alpha subunit
LVANITRFYGHFEGDPQHYRAKDEVARHRESMDCLKRFRSRVESERALSLAELDAIDSDVLSLIDRAVETAKAAPLPELSELTTDVYIRY